MTSGSLRRTGNCHWRPRTEPCWPFRRRSSSHRDLSALFHELAGRLHQVVQFDGLALVLHEAASNTMRLHVLETSEPTPHPPVLVLPVEDDPAGLVWQNQQPLITSSVAELGRWPGFLERVQPYGVQSFCWLPLTTARRRLGTLVFACKQPSAYDTADVGFLQLVANQVAVAVDNALAFQEIDGAEGPALQGEGLPGGGGPHRAQLRGDRRARAPPCAGSSSRSRPSPPPAPRCSFAAKRARARSSSPAPFTT